MRCIETLSTVDTYTPLSTRVIRAVAAIVDSPGGSPFRRGTDDEVFRWAGSWNKAATTVSFAPDHSLLVALGDGQNVVEQGRGAAFAVEELAEWWLAVPLNHAGRLLGFVLVGRSRAGFKLDREAFDLLRVLGREVAIFVAEQRA